MSTEYVDEAALEQTRQHLRGLMHEVEAAVQSDIELNAFYELLLSRTVHALAAVGGAIWTLNSNGQLELSFQMNLDQTRLAESEDAQQKHGRMLRKIVDGGPPRVVEPHSSDGEGQEGNPTDFLVLLGPMHADKQIEGVLEVFQRAGAPPATQKGYLRFLLQMCGLAGEYLKTHRLRHFHERQSLWARLESFTRTAHHSLDPRAACYNIANEGRRLIECDRVSVAINKGTKCKVESVSGQEIFDNRSNTITLLNKLSTAVCAAGDEVWYTGDTSNMPPQVEKALQEYIDDSHSKTVAILPLRRPPEDETDREAEPNPVVGALIVEQIEETKLAEGFRQRVRVVADHSSTALANAVEHNQLFLMPVWRTIGKASWMVKARTLPKTIAIAATIGAIILALCLVPWSFELQGKGTLEPVEKREIFARVTGTVSEILKERGNVKLGDLLMRIDSTDVKNELERLQGEHDAHVQESNAKVQALNSGQYSEAERKRLKGEIESLNVQIRALEKQIDLVKKEKVAYLDVKSPLDGEIISWQLREKLEGRPVEKGQVLMTVADLQKDWDLEIRMPEERMGHIKQAMAELPEGEAMKVTYIVATDPGVKHFGTVKEVHRSAEVHGEDGNTVLIRVKINKDDLKEIRPGAGVTAKLYCGSRPIGYVWFHDVLAFIQSKILFRI